jgi:hypothetical protein
MNLSKFNAFSKEGLVEEGKTFFSATLISLLVFGSVYAYDAYALDSTQVETLTVTIDPAVTFAVSTDSFGNLTPGTYKIATSTTVVTTNATTWSVLLYGNNTGTGLASSTLYIIADAATNNKIPDGTQWNATSTATTTSASLTSATISPGVDFLYFRVMTASGTQAFRSTAWWGADDNISGSAKWAGVASSTASFLTGRRIGSVTGYSGSNIINTVQYYLDVGVSQQQGTYTGDLTYTWTSAA